MKVSRWPLGPTGLLFDREWAIIDSNGRALRMKNAPTMCFIQPRVMLDTQSLVVSAPGMDDLTISFSQVGMNEEACAVNVCGQRCEGMLYDASVSAWFSKYLGMPVTFVRSFNSSTTGTGSNREEDGGTPPALNPQMMHNAKVAFSNEAQFLLVSRPSIDHLNALISAHTTTVGPAEEEALASNGTSSSLSIIGHHGKACVAIENFRPNLVIAGGEAHQEDRWGVVRMGSVAFRVTGPCSRCSMVNIDPQQGTTHIPVLKTLAAYRREKSKIYFGQFLCMEEFGTPIGTWLTVGDELQVYEAKS